MSEESVIINTDTGQPFRHWVLSIDFGTSSTVAVAAYGDRPEALQREVIEFEGERRVPSVVLVDDDGALVVGHAAAHLAASRPDRVIRTPKRRLGDQRPVILGGRAHEPVELASAILGHVARHAIDRLGSDPDEVRLTHPVTWNRPLQQRLLEAAAKAGLENVTLIPEPVAAAMSLGPAAVPAGGSLAVYDLGGGTFDTTVVRSTGDGFEVLGDPIGDPSIGGELFDEMLMNLVGSRLDAIIWEQLQVSDDPSWRQSAARMLAECQRVKEALSLHEYAEVVVSHPSGVVTERVTRSELDELIATYIDESVRLTTWSVVEAGVQETLSGVRLIGGASRMPIVSRSVAAAFPGVEVQVDHDPRTAVAMGASMAPSISPSISPSGTPANAVGTTVEEPAPLPPPVAPSTVVASPEPPTVAAMPAETTPAGPTPVAAPTVVGSQDRTGIDTRSPVVLVGVGMLAVFLLAGAVWAVWPDRAKAEIATGPNSSLSSEVDDLGGGTTSTTQSPVTTPSTSPSTLPPTTSMPSTLPPSTLVDTPPTDGLASILLTGDDLGSDWVERTYSDADDASEFCELEPAATAVGEEGRVWDRDLLSLTSSVYEYATEQDAIDVVAQDRRLATDCPSSTQLVEGAEFVVAVAQPDVIPDNLSFGDEVAAASFVLLSTDLDLTIYVFTFEQRWGRTIAQTSFFSTAPFDEDQTQSYITHTLKAFQRHVELPR